VAGSAYAPALMRLVLVRHANAAPGSPDELRPLTPNGRAQARELVRQLAGERPDAVLTSPLLRARETAGPIARAAGLAVEPSDLLAPGATADDVLLAVAGRGETVVVVGHNPDCERIAAELGADAPHGFPPAGFAVIDLRE
jgi:phosphohistidine phosphatase